MNARLDSDTHSLEPGSHYVLTHARYSLSGIPAHMNADTTIATLIGNIALYDSLARNTINMMKATAGSPLTH